MEEEKGYRYRLRCGNCGKGGKIVRIPMGNTVKEFLGNYVENCEVCGCCEWEGVGVFA